jgi:hypothetical protein
MRHLDVIVSHSFFCQLGQSDDCMALKHARALLPALQDGQTRLRVERARLDAILVMRDDHNIVVEG